MLDRPRLPDMVPHTYTGAWGLLQAYSSDPRQHLSQAGLWAHRVEQEPTMDRGKWQMPGDPRPVRGGTEQDPSQDQAPPSAL